MRVTCQIFKTTDWLKKWGLVDHTLGYTCVGLNYYGTAGELLGLYAEQNPESPITLHAEVFDGPDVSSPRIAAFTLRYAPALF